MQDSPQIPHAWSRAKGPSLSPVGLGAHGSPARTGEVRGWAWVRGTALRWSEKDPFLNWPVIQWAHPSLEQQVNTAGKIAPKVILTVTQMVKKEELV